MTQSNKTVRGRQNRTKSKRVRVPFGAHRYKLQLSQDDLQEFKKQGYVVRWFNDQDGRIQRAIGGGWNHVKPEEAPSLGHGAIHETNSDLGSVVSKIVSKGQPAIRAFLMKIKEKYYWEDQEAKEEINARVDEALYGGAAGGAHVENQYGDGVKITKI